MLYEFDTILKQSAHDYFSGLVACLCWFHLLTAVKKTCTLNKLKIGQDYLNDTILPSHERFALK